MKDIIYPLFNSHTQMKQYRLTLISIMYCFHNFYIRIQNIINHNISINRQHIKSIIMLLYMPKIFITKSNKICNSNIQQNNIKFISCCIIIIYFINMLI